LKKISYLDTEDLSLIKLKEANGYKFELHLKSFIPFIEAGKLGVLKVDRDDEYAPIKNAEGSPVDSPNIARQLFAD
jgi:UDP-N-acetylglucosamine/UDP-N-acetylgalactosamine diphosphorylase